MTAEDMPEYSNWLIIATTIFLVWALMFAGVRVWAKVTRNLSWSAGDSIFAGAFSLGVAQCTCVYLAISFGFEREDATPSTSDALSYKKTLFASHLLYVMCVGLSKCSTTLFLGNLTRSVEQQRPALAIAAVCGIWTVACSFVVGLRANIRRPWISVNDPASMYTRWLAIEASGLALEVIIWIYAVTLVWGLNMQIPKRMKIIALFGVRLLLAPILAGRLYFLAPWNQGRSPYAVTMSSIFTEAAMQFSLMSECMACLKPFLQPFYPGYGVSSQYNLGYHSNPSREVYTELSNISQSKGADFKKEMQISQLSVPSRAERRNASKTPSRRSSQRQIINVEHDPMPFQGKHASLTSRVEAQAGSKGARRSDEDDIELLPSAGMVIQQTRTVSMIEEREQQEQRLAREHDESGP